MLSYSFPVSLFTSNLKIIFVNVICYTSKLKFENLYSVVQLLHTSDSDSRPVLRNIAFVLVI